MNIIKISPLFSLLLISTIHCSQYNMRNKEDQKIFLRNLAKGTNNWNKFIEYKKIADSLPNQLALFDGQCKKYTANPTTAPTNQPNINPCDLLEKFKVYQDAFGKEFIGIKEAALKTNQALTYDEFIKEHPQFADDKLSTD